MDENNNATMPNDEYEPLLPDGWEEDGELFGDESDGPLEVETSGESEEAPAEGEIADPTDSDPSTTSESEEPGAEDAEGSPTTENDSVSSANSKLLRFQARIDHEDRDVELNEADLPTIYQKAQATDRAQQRMKEMQDLNDRISTLSRQMGFDTPDAFIKAATANHREAMIEQMVEEGTAQSVAEFIADQRLAQMGQTPSGAPTDGAPTSSGSPTPSGNPTMGGQAQAPVGNDQTGQSGQRDYSSEVMELLRARPQLVGKPLPDEVVNAATAGGKRLLDAYTDFENAGARKETERLRKENSVLKQNAEAAKRAPVRSSSEGGKTDTRPTDPFLEGFNSDKW